MGRFRSLGFAAAAGCLFVVASTASSTAAAAPSAPEAVSPAAGWGEALVEARCPAFSWAGVEGARGYELVVFAVAPEGPESAGEPVVVSRARLSPGARSWTPSLGNCLERGGRYAWSVRAVTEAGEGAWSEPAIFRVAAGPSLQEVEAAMEILRQHRAEQQEGGREVAEGQGALSVEAAEPPHVLPDARLRERLAAAQELRAVDGAEGVAPAWQSAEAGFKDLPLAIRESSGSLALASAPVLGNPSLSVSANVSLGPASNLFKDGSVFVWDDLEGNTALGRGALASAGGTATSNTAVGRRALESTTAGAQSFHGSRNTAVGEGALRFNSFGSANTATGDLALYANTTGTENTATGRMALLQNTIGYRNSADGVAALFSNSSGANNTAHGVSALFYNTTGSRNTATGFRALGHNTQGNRNVAIGDEAGLNVVGASRDDNIFILNSGVATDSKKIRIGTQGVQLGTFIAGIRPITTGSANAITVLVDSNGQLGTVNSSRELKQDIQDIDDLSRLLALRPVAFRYRQHAADDPETPLQFGLIAEEVAAVFPELVVYDRDGRPETVKYHLLSALLLAELQAERRELEELRGRLEAVENGRPPAAVEPRRRWWSRQ